MHTATQIPDSMATGTRNGGTSAEPCKAPGVEPSLDSEAVLSIPNPAVDVIEQRPRWCLVRVGELWRYRELLYFFTWRDVKVRYKQTALGALWAVLQPFGTMVVFSLFLGGMMRSSMAIPYPLFVYAGLLPWTFVAHAVSSASQSIVGSERLVTKVYFPRLMLPASAVTAALVDFAIAFVLLGVMMIYYGVSPGVSVLMVPALVLTLFVTALGMGTLLAALTVAYRDVRYVVPFLIQMWMFLTPSIYMGADDVLASRGKLILPLNPIHGLVANFRHALVGGSIDWPSFGWSFGVSALLLIVGCAYFGKTERVFADVI